jgi:hypothetical protein
MIFAAISSAENLIEASKNENKGDPTILSFYFLIPYSVIFFNNRVLVRLYLLKNRIKVFLVYESIVILSYAAIQLYSSKFFDEKPNVISAFSDAFYILLFGMGFYFFHIWITQNTIGLKKKLIANENELSILKHQLNPHFLLNAINNLYGVSLAEPKLVSEKILELADLLHYQLEAIKKDKVLIADEIEFCKNYIAYMQYKSNNLKIESSITGNYQMKRIHTLLFLPLIENAIKYASETQIPQVNINWLFEEDYLIFTISNNFTNAKTKGTEIGLANLKRRLEILDTKSELIITENDFFKVQLTLWI